MDSKTDALGIPSDLLGLHDWSVKNMLPLNIPKCHVLRFTRKKTVLDCTYSINGTPLDNRETITDLGVTFSSSLSFTDHIRRIQSSALKSLGLIRHDTDFKNPPTFKILYSALVLPHLEYASQVWNPAQSNHIQLLEVAQHKFLRYVAFKINKPMSITCHNYDGILNTLNIRTMADLVLVYKTINQIVDCPGILELLKFYVPRIP